MKPDVDVHHLHPAFFMFAGIKMNNKTLNQIQQHLADGKLTAVSLTESYLGKITEHQSLNAFLEVFEADAIAQAKAIDAKIAAGQPLGRLHGLVIGIKDNICYKGHKVSAGSKILENFTSIYSSTVVEKLLAADAIIIGRLNCDEFAMGSSNENSAYGPVRNALDPTRVPGGSSGGSAVAVQAGLCHASLGSDTGGSIRQPASFCGVVGVKPTYGRVSRYGLIAYASSFDQIGPFANSVEDAALITSVISGADDYDATASQKSVEAFEKETWTGKARIAVLKNTIDHPGLHPEVRTAAENVINNWKLQGHIIEEVPFDLMDHLIATYYVLTTAEASSNLARFDGVHYGFRAPDAVDMETVYKRSRTEGFGREVKNRIMLGTFVLSAGYYDAYYSRAQRVRRILQNKLREIFKSYDFILMPTAPSVAFKLGEKTSDPVEMYLADIYTVLANLTGVPAISLPLAKNAEGLPIGMQLLADQFQEGKLFAFSKQVMP
ncbi:MAG: Asp-tRNA(Asn)/Glu-tRNA(Gln) amidotransferase subunit GatA [Chitinophagales bacterium]